MLERRFTGTKYEYAVFQRWGARKPLPLSAVRGSARVGGEFLFGCAW
jgi:hypothetical protein